jgi:hypothetical protein
MPDDEAAVIAYIEQQDERHRSGREDARFERDTTPRPESA